MAEIVEISIERIRLSQLIEFLIKLDLSSNLKDYQIPSDNQEPEFDISSQNILYDFFDKVSDGSFYFNFKKFKLEEFELSEVGLQVLKYDNQLDINICLDYDCLRIIDSIVFLQNWTNKVSKYLEAKTYYCGYEPASDRDTRFFTENIFGPIKYGQKR